MHLLKDSRKPELTLVRHYVIGSILVMVHHMIHCHTYSFSHAVSSLSDSPTQLSEAIKDHLPKMIEANTGNVYIITHWSSYGSLFEKPESHSLQSAISTEAEYQRNKLLLSKSNVNIRVCSVDKSMESFAVERIFKGVMQSEQSIIFPMKRFILFMIIHMLPEKLEKVLLKIYFGITTKC